MIYKLDRKCLRGRVDSFLCFVMLPLFSYPSTLASSIISRVVFANDGWALDEGKDEVLLRSSARGGQRPMERLHVALQDRSIILNTRPECALLRRTDCEVFECWSCTHVFVGGHWSAIRGSAYGNPRQRDDRKAWTTHWPVAPANTCDGNDSADRLWYSSTNEDCFYIRQATGHRACDSIPGEERMRHPAASH